MASRTWNVLRRLRFAGALCLSIAAITTTAHALTIDEFQGNAIAESRDPVTPANVTVSSGFSGPNILGGSRVIYARRNSSTGRVALETEPSPGYDVLDLQQSVSAPGRTTVIWDGDNNPSFNPSGLGQFDIVQDGGTALLFTGLGVQPGEDPKQLTITVRLYDSSDPSGQTFAVFSKLYTAATPEGGINEEFPFASFTFPNNDQTLLNRIGAVVLEIDGSRAADLELDRFGTNGTCAVTPRPDGSVFDECGVCGGNNEAKDSCGVCFGGDQDKDDCGICFGGNASKDSCGICFGNDASKDQCGVCGGDNTSCADCLGTPNGGKTFDQCGICGGDGKSCLDCAGTVNGKETVDRCGVCGGDGRSCVQCVNNDVSSTIASLKAKSNEQRVNAIFFLQGLQKSDKKFKTKSRKTVERLYQELLAQIDKLPLSVLQCEPNPFCVQTSANESAVSEYQVVIEELYKLSIKILRRTKLGPGTCRGSVKACVARNRKATRNRKTLEQLARRLRNENRQISETVPLTLSVCS